MMTNPDKEWSEHDKKQDALDDLAMDVLARVMAMTAEDIIIGLKNLRSTNAKSLGRAIEENMETAAWYFAKYGNIDE